MRFLRGLLVLIFLLVVTFGIAYYFAGRAAGPAIAINHPSAIGQASTLDVTIDTPDAVLSELRIELSQQGKTFRVIQPGAPSEGVVKEAANRLHITRPIGKKWLPELQSGPATVKVTASRPVLRGLRQAVSEATRDVQVRLEPPRLAVVSTHHFVNVGGSEMIVYRVTPPDVESGVRVSDVSYPGFPGAEAGLSDPALKVAFLVLPYNQKPNTPMELYARDVAGNEARAQFDHRTFPKAFRSSRIPLDDAFLSRVVPSIAAKSPQIGATSGDLLPVFLKINNDLRRENNATIAALAKKTAPAMLWKGAFQPFGGAQVESAFADFRTYTYASKDVDRQVHLGFDLAKTANAPVTAGNDGKVLYAADLGIYGNCVILDHGMGVQSLYGHLSSIDVKEGQDVRKGQTLGLSGQTGLAGGDHLHFSMLVNGQFVNATEWWDPHWIEDRITRKLREAGASSPAPVPVR